MGLEKGRPGPVENLEDPAQMHLDNSTAPALIGHIGIRVSTGIDAGRPRFRALRQEGPTMGSSLLSNRVRFKEV
jgi:hypothetical protein